MSRKKKKADISLDILEDTMDDDYAFIAGHTSWGFPYGTTWEEIGIDPTLPFEEKKKLYLHGCYKIPSLTESQKSDLKVMLNTLNNIQVKLEVYGNLSGVNDLCGIAENVRDVMDRIAVHVDEEELPF